MDTDSTREENNAQADCESATALRILSLSVRFVRVGLNAFKCNHSILQQIIYHVLKPQSPPRFILVVIYYRH